MPAAVALAAAATRETDAALKKEYTAKGAAAFEANETRDKAPDGLIGKWWLEGYDKAARKGT